MRNRFELARIEGPLSITSIAYTIIDGVRDVVEYRCVLNQGVNNEWRNIFQAAWDKATAPTSGSPAHLRKLAVPTVAVGTVFVPGMVTFVCERALFQEVALLIKELIEAATRTYLTQLGIHELAVHPHEASIQEEISAFMESMTAPVSAAGPDAEPVAQPPDAPEASAPAGDSPPQSLPE